MKHILFINACVRPNSRTRRLAQAVLETQNGIVTEIILEKEDMKPLNYFLLQAREDGIRAGDFSSPSFRYAKQFACADEIVIAAPFWDLAFPSILKIYLEAVAVNYITFRYSDKGELQGLCRASTLTYITTAGGQIGSYDFGFEYIQALAKNLFGIGQAIYLKAERLDVQGNDPEKILKQAEQTIVYENAMGAQQ